jgi:hypothetical protein
MALTQSLSGQVTINNTIVVWNDNNNLPSGYDDGIILTNNAQLTLENVDLFMKPTTSITIGMGCKLIIDGTTIESSNIPSFWGGIVLYGDLNVEQYDTPPDSTVNNTSAWEGVLLEEQPIVIIKNSSNINYAHWGVESIGGGIVRARNSTFWNCERGIFISTYISPTYPNLNASYIMDCDFLWDFPRSYYQFGLFLVSVKTINVGGCNFINNITGTSPILNCSGDKVSGIYISDAGVTIGSSGNSFCFDNPMNCPDNCYDGQKGSFCTFERLRYAIYNNNNSLLPFKFGSEVSVRYSTFLDNYHSIYVYDMNKSPDSRWSILFNSFSTSNSTVSLNHKIISEGCETPDGYLSFNSVGIIDLYLYNTAFTVYQNNFSGDGARIKHVVINEGTLDVNKKGHIVDNIFSNTSSNTVATDLVYGVLVVSQNSMTKVSCNTFENMGTDIKIAPGATLQNPMTDKDGNAAGNTFSNILGGRYRIDNSGNPNVDYKLETTYTPNGPEDPIPLSSSINVNKLATAEDPSSCELACTELYTNNWGLSVRNTDYNSNQISVYPNPVNSELNILINTGVISNIVIYDMLGKVVYSNSPNTISIVIDIQNFANGMYLVSITDDNNQIYSSKIIKE